MELQGKMMYCLKEKFRESKLTTSCENEIANILKEQALNYRLDPLLGKLCKAEIQTICAVQTDITSSDGQVIKNYISRQINKLLPLYYMCNKKLLWPLQLSSSLHLE